MSSDSSTKKIIIAVHGIGEQFQYATAQSVISRLCGYYGEPCAIPLGRFHTTSNEPLPLCPPYSPEHFGRIYFAEVYWAGIPREIIESKYTLEETKRWARTIVERVQMCGQMGRDKLKAESEESAKKGDKATAMQKASAVQKCRQSSDEIDYSLLKQVLEEMLQTIAVAQRLCYLAEKANLFTFDLKRLLDDYLGDVQIVTEFQEKRQRILTEFNRVLSEAYHFDNDAELYLVTHSEGTVVALLGLLTAMRDKHPWVRQVRGFMTLGSPIDKHLILWRDELWCEFESGPPVEAPAPATEAASAPTTPPAPPIPWWNYYDFGDPIGFELDEARAWLKVHGWDTRFHFTKDQDRGFRRYLFPGKAHVDYWTDPHVFGHFLQKVVGLPPLVSQSEPQKNAKPADFSQPPGNKWWPLLTNYALPYLLVFALLFAGVFLLDKAVTHYLWPDNPGVSLDIFRNVFGITCLLFGLTVAARIPRLTSVGRWHLVGPLLFAAMAAIHLLLAQAPVTALGAEIEESLPFYRPGYGKLILATGILIVVGVIGLFRRSRSYGMHLLLGLGGVTVLGLIVATVARETNQTQHGALWPLLLATLLFLYLWWLAALLFDLAFVWHLYIRQSEVQRRLGQIVASEKAQQQWKQAAKPTEQPAAE